MWIYQSIINDYWLWSESQTACNNSFPHLLWVELLNLQPLSVALEAVGELDELQRVVLDCLQPIKVVLAHRGKPKPSCVGP